MASKRKRPASRTLSRQAGKFGRALLPPGKFHSTKKGARGYRRTNQKEEARHTLEQSEPSASS